jgi:DNA repair exonuclease SbcCD nuclease subunit
MALRFLHLADCHLGAAHGDFPERAKARREEVKSTFRAALEWALDPAHAIDGVLVAGDLFDSRRPDSDTLGFVRSLFARLVGAGVAVVVLPGSHDSLAYPDSVFRSERFPGIDVIVATAPGAPLVREIRGERVSFYGVACIAGRSPEAFPGFVRAGEEGIHVGLLHGMVPGHAEEAARPEAWRLPQAALAASGLDYVALGHCHQFTEYRLPGGGTAAYCGALEGVRFAPGDLGRKHLVVATVAQGSVALEPVPFSRKVLVDEVINLGTESVKDADGLRTAILSRSGSDVLARLTLTGAREFTWNREALSAELADRFAALKLVDRSSFEQSLLLRRVGAENTIRGFFVRRVRQRLEKLREQAQSPYADRDIDRQIAVAERALTVGLEQFLDEDALARPAAEAPAAAAPKPVEHTAEPTVTVVALSNANGSVTTVKATVENLEDRRVPIVEGA